MINKKLLCLDYDANISILDKMPTLCLLYCGNVPFDNVKRIIGGCIEFGCLSFVIYSDREHHNNIEDEIDCIIIDSESQWSEYVDLYNLHTITTISFNRNDADDAASFFMNSYSCNDFDLRYIMFHYRDDDIGFFIDCMKYNGFDVTK